MKRFKQHINEEWVADVGAMIGRMGDTTIWKNPANRDWSEYTGEIYQHGFAGLYHKGDVYVFDGERLLHRHAMDYLKIKPSKDTVQFRGKLSSNKRRIMNIAPGGDDITKLGDGKIKLKSYFPAVMKLYNHSSMKPRMAQLPNKALQGFVIWAGSKEEFEQLTGVYL